MRRQTLTLEQLAYLAERRTARYMGMTLKQYREEQNALIDALGMTEKKRGIYHQKCQKLRRRGHK